MDNGNISNENNGITIKSTELSQENKQIITNRIFNFLNIEYINTIKEG